MKDDVSYPEAELREPRFPCAVRGAVNYANPVSEPAHRDG